VVADVVGYLRLIEMDEAGTLAALKERRTDILQPIVRAHDGRIVKVMWDGVLLEFASAINAVTGAIELQRKMAEANESLPATRRVVLRIGINLGDVIVEGSDVYGDGVNIAARLESLAEPGGIYISRAIHDQVNRKLKLGVDDLGLKVLKNIAEPVHVYRVRTHPSAILDHVGQTPGALALPSKPSIAVLPFTNMSGNAEQDVFTDGLTEDLITELSRNPGLFVIARHSTFAYKGKSVDILLVARDFGVRYIVEGSARRADDRVRVNAQLIDSTDGDHLWVERFDRSLDDIFSVQDEVTSKIVEALVGRLNAQPARNRPKSMEAYDLCVRARALNTESPQASQEAHLLLKRAIEIDPDYAEAHRWLAMNMWMGWVHWGQPMEPNRRMAVETAEEAVSLDPNDANSHWVLGHILAYERRWDESDREFSLALELDPNNADAWAQLSDKTVLSGRPGEALEQISKALRLNPHPAGWYYVLLGQAQYALRQYEAAVETLRRDEAYRTSARRSSQQVWHSLADWTRRATRRSFLW